MSLSICLAFLLSPRTWLWKDTWFATTYYILLLLIIIIIIIIIFMFLSLHQTTTFRKWKWNERHRCIKFVWTLVSSPFLLYTTLSKILLYASFVIKYLISYYMILLCVAFLFSFCSVFAEIQGPQGTAYDGGIFKLDIEVPDRYIFCLSLYQSIAYM